MGNGARPFSPAATPPKEAVMLITLVLTHPCGETVNWSAGAYTDRDGQPVEHCGGCGEWLGTPFVRAEEASPPVHAAQARLHLQAS